ncbi:helix-turn-helix transcriptional regulator [Cumulibacter manganitolerans]|uniref:helix-turn-helix transcriptional regulator n=1 Tax=Cumulibacter manganitolerans TaxID=1884992 RepID=UPI00129583AE|nr:helix-turn-helix transcriptional regulator [Cumulibacter manganitolerans]
MEDALARARDRLARAHDANLDAAVREVLDALELVTRFDWAAVMTVDPVTLLPGSGAAIKGFEPAVCQPYWHHEILVPGFNKFVDLARGPRYVATLVEATDGDVTRASTWEIYGPLGAADELRVAFCVGSSCWGVASLVRAAVDGPFPEAEAAAVEALAPVAARLLRAAVTAMGPDAGGSDCAVVVVGPTNQLVSASPAAEPLLEALRTRGMDGELPTILGAVASRARSSGSSSTLATRMYGAAGRWLRVTSAPLSGPDGNVAIVVEPARPADVIPMILEGYGLTRREIEVVGRVAQGGTTQKIARELGLSPHTVRDHIKSIFEKVGVGTRGELVAHLHQRQIGPFEPAPRR